MTKPKTPYLPWEEKFSVGVEEIDAQHKMLVQMINDLHDAMMAKTTKEAIRDIVDRMAEYAVVHFATEEKYMLKFDYPGYARHKREHDGFTQKAIDLQTRVAHGTLVLSLEVITFLRDWLTHHILGSDKEFGPYFNAHGLR